MHDHDPRQEPAPSEEPQKTAPPLPPGPPATRVDRWLWAVRLTKTRSDAAQACRAGHVRVNDKPAKPATSVKVGDRVRARVNGVTRIVEVTHIIEKRVGAPIATRCYIDHTPAVPPELAVPVAAAPAALDVPPSGNAASWTGFGGLSASTQDPAQHHGRAGR